MLWVRMCTCGDQTLAPLACMNCWALRAAGVAGFHP